MSDAHPSHSPAFVALVDEARARIRQTDVETVRDRMAAGEDFRLVDVREESEWRNGHLPGAVHISRGVLERDVERALPERDAPIVLYCGGGYRSALAAESLGKMGYRDVESMDGGYRAWYAAGYPVVEGPDSADHG